MVTKKDLVIAVLSTFCLTATLFIIIPTRSSPAIGEYDPWIDYDENRKIDWKDLLGLARTYGSLGNPTKNVNVTNWPSQQVEPLWKIEIYDNAGHHYNISQADYGKIGAVWATPKVRCNGFSRMFINVKLINITHQSLDDSTTFQLDFIRWYATESTYEYFVYQEFRRDIWYSRGTLPNPLNFTVDRWYGEAGSSAIETHGIMADFALPTVDSTQESGWALMDFWVYLRNE